MTFKTSLILLFVILWIGLVPAVVFGGAQQADSAKAYKIKAAFLLNFAKFISWPEEGAAAPGNDSFKICVLGKDPFGSALTSVSSRSIGSRKIELHYISTVAEAEAEDCQLLFVSGSEKGNVDAIQAQLGQLPVAMVSDIKGFTQAGGTIEFVSQENKLTFNINLRRAREQGLKIHSALLNLASEVIQ